MEFFFQELLIWLFLLTPILAALGFLGFLTACVFDRVDIRQGKRKGLDVSKRSAALKRHRKCLLVSGVITGCSLLLLIVFMNMALANM
jgi:hypothetical protein